MEAEIQYVFHEETDFDCGEDLSYTITAVEYPSGACVAQKGTELIFNHFCLKLH